MTSSHILANLYLVVVFGFFFVLEGKATGKRLQDLILITWFNFRVVRTQILFLQRQHFWKLINVCECLCLCVASALNTDKCIFWLSGSSLGRLYTQQCLDRDYCSVMEK